jgi:hypothetical protein
MEFNKFKVQGILTVNIKVQSICILVGNGDDNQKNLPINPKAVFFNYNNCNL